LGLKGLVVVVVVVGDVLEIFKTQQTLTNLVGRKAPTAADQEKLN
jgi:hypothetical protein